MIDAARWPYTDILFARCKRKANRGRQWACNACGFPMVPGALYMNMKYTVADDEEIQFGRYWVHDGCYQVQQSAWHMVGALPGELLNVQEFLRVVGEGWLTEAMPFRPTRSPLADEAFWNHSAGGFRPLPPDEKLRLLRIIDSRVPPQIPVPVRWHKETRGLFRSEGLPTGEWLKKYGNARARESFARGADAETAAWTRLRQFAV